MDEDEEVIFDEGQVTPETGTYREDGSFVPDGQTQAVHEMSLQEMTAHYRRVYPGGVLPNGVTTSDADMRMLYDACQHAARVILARNAHRGSAQLTLWEGGA